MRTILMRCGLARLVVAMLASLTAVARGAGFDVSAYLDDQTFAVVHADLGQVDTAAIEKYATDIFDEAKMPADADLRRMVAMSRLAADGFLARFKQLGGRDIYVVVSQADFYPPFAPPAVLFPVESGKAKGLADFLRLMMSEGTGIGVVELREDVVALADARVVERLRKTAESPAKLEALSRGLAEIAGVPLGAVSAPSADQRRVIAELLPTLPREFTGELMSTEFFTRGYNYSTFAITLPPNPSVTLTGDMNNGADAQRVVEIYDLCVKRLIAWEEFQRALISKDPSERAAANAFKKFIESVRPQATLTMNGGTAMHRVTFRVDAEQFRNLALVITPLTELEHKRAQRNMGLNQLRNIAIAVVTYAADNNDTYPDSLQVLVDKKLLTASQITDSNDPQHRPFSYRAWTAAERKKLDPSSTPIAWSDFETVPGNVVVAFMDGHAEVMPTAYFHAQLNTANEKVK